jgi:4-nitrophenyl phosphatase
MRRYPLYIFDLDGTVYRGGVPIPGAVETLAELRKDGALIRFLTNNSSQTQDAQAGKLEKMGIAAVPDEIMTSGVGTAHYLEDQGLDTAYVIGEPGLVEVLASRGIRRCVQGETAKTVVVGICRTLTYEMVDQALQQILKGARFVATNTDATYPMEGGRVVPGAGAMVAAVQTCAGVDPVVIGKPNPFLVEMTLNSAGVNAKEALVIGDRYETDIVSGKAAGCDTLLVLTGVTSNVPGGLQSAESLLELLA